MTVDSTSTGTPVAIPALPPGAPTLARHLHWALGYITALGLGPQGTQPFTDALDALKAIPAVPLARLDIDGVPYWRDEEGAMLPERLIKPGKLVEDLFVRTVAAGALATHGTLGRLKAMSFSEAAALIDALASQYGVKVGGKVGNVSFFSYDRAWKVQISVQERLAVNANIEAAKAALNEWLAEAEASDEVRALVNAAFGLGDQDGVRVAELVRLKKLPIDHPKWKAAMAAIDDALEPACKAQYLRVYQRRPDGKYVQIALDLASA